ncbi:protein of unknown function DUF2786 [Xanthomonas phage Mallos]|uniref:DUF2786 domain-containing protein n=1 Tax=Xanthomonas phage Mallos TaxID=2939131 RepID=A0A9E7J5G5_9CAUD|nr:protein of unknown function DUF2786 [Xanthomonas phage Mallos]URA07180.1 protein of unknown function DUF2786 [Xanthomonas phage Mallos]
MDDTRREKLISRLKKCLALSASPEPHEAAAALRQAQKLMRELDLTEADLLGLELADALVKTREGFGACRTMNFLTSIIQDAFGVQCIYERNPGTANRLNVRYVGPRDKVLLAEYSHKVVWRAMQSSWDTILMRWPRLKGDGGKRQAFHIGWLCGVREKIEALVPSDEETAAVNSWIARRYGELTPGKEVKQKPLNAAAFHAGQEAAADFNLHTPVEEQTLSLTHQGA